MARISLWVKPGSREDSLGWDRWRRRWIASCRAPPTGGRANREVANLMADWLGVPSSAVHWITAGSSRAKVLEVEGLSDLEVARRLRVHIVDR